MSFNEKHQKQAPKAIIWQNLKKGPKTPKIAKNDQKHQKTSKMAKNTKKRQKWPKIAKCQKWGSPKWPPGAPKKKRH